MKASKPKYSTGWIIFIIIWEVIAVSGLILGSIYWYGQQDDGASEGWSTIIRNLGLGAAGILGLPFLVWQTFQRDRTSNAEVRQADASEREVELSQQFQVPERFTKTVELFTNNSAVVRLSAIYALETISRLSETDYWSIMDILADFVREATVRVNLEEFERLQKAVARATVKNEKEELENKIEWWLSKNKNNADVLAAMKVMGRSKQKLRPEEIQHDVQGLDLSFIKIIKLDLTRLNFSSAVANNACFMYSILKSAQFKGTVLSKANFRGAILERANLMGAKLVKANLEAADLREANLHIANLRAANLAEANLEGARLAGAELEGTNLKGVIIERTDWFEYLGKLDEPPLGLDRLQQKYWIDPNKPQKDKYGNTFYSIELRPQGNESH